MALARGTRNALVALGLTVFGGLCAAYPVYYAINGPRLVKSPDKLVGEAIARGAYVNAGSKDVGPDPNVGRYHNSQ